MAMEFLVQQLKRIFSRCQIERRHINVCSLLNGAACLRVQPGVWHSFFGEAPAWSPSSPQDSATFIPEQVSISSPDLNRNNGSSLCVPECESKICLEYLHNLAIAGSAPGERPPHHFKEQLVGFPEVAAKLLEGLGAQRCMRAALGLVQALVVSSRQQAVEALGGVVIEVVWADPGWQLQEPLGLPQLREGIPNERIAVHHMNLLPGEHLQPPGEVLVVQAPLQRLVPGVNVAVADQELLERLVGLVAGQAVVKDLGVVRHQPLSRVPDN